MSAKLATPWGPADFAKRSPVTRGAITADVISVSTPGHGGYFVPDELLQFIPKLQRRWAAKWSRSENWFEEDCCWSAVALAFPELFPAGSATLAQQLVDTYAKEAA